MPYAPSGSDRNKQLQRQQPPRHKIIWGSGRTAPPFFTSALDEGERSLSRPGCFNPRDRDPSTHWIGGLMYCRARLDSVAQATFETFSDVVNI
jgi:hypothetical protein